ncbi:MAG: phosphoribosylamine--glycine ligase [bacterium]|nr:phosphoribosylamine--glycine ligase [bacterium]
MKKNILIIGSGGREHALGWKLSQSPKIGKIFFAPGNGGTRNIGENINIKAIEIDKLLDFVLKNKIDLTVVGPEDPLVIGIVDLFEKNKLLIFGPSQLAARLESSKSWAADFMTKYNIPQPLSFKFTDYKKAYLFFENHKAVDFVIKASGLALGKGVILPQSKKEALDMLKKIMIDKVFGDSGNEIVIQEKLIGQEVSIIALCDGKTIIPLLPAQDHKRIFDNDKGPNTGGMGAFAPVSFMTKKLINQIHKIILQPTIDGMKKENAPFKGILYAGLMITKNGPKVMEYNVRFGDPETQPQMMMMKSDLYSLIMDSINVKLKNKKILFNKGVSVCVVIASKGYPGAYQKGDVIHGLDKKYGKDLFVFQAGTTYKENQIITSGGRVLGVTGFGKDVKTAIKKAYSIIGKKGVYFKGMQYRKDIAQRVL